MLAVVLIDLLLAFDFSLGARSKLLDLDGCLGTDYFRLAGESMWAR